MLRFILACLSIGLFLILTLPVLPILWLIGKWKPMVKDMVSLRMAQWIFRVILWFSGTKTTVIGEENIPTDQAVLYILNHRSLFDVLLTYPRCKNRTGYIAKAEILKAPILPIWMKRLYCLFLDRKDIKAGLKTILTAIDYIKSGISIAIFPEGTRSRSDNELEMLPFHEGSFKIATKTGCPIIPVAISHSSAIFEDHLPYIRSTHTVVEYGTPIYPDQLSKEDRKFIGRYVQEIIGEMLKKNQELV